MNLFWWSVSYAHMNLMIIDQFAFVIDSEGQIYGCEAVAYGMGYFHRQKSLTAIMAEEFRLMCVEFSKNLSRDFVNGLKHRFKNDVTISSGVNQFNSRTMGARDQRRILAMEIYYIDVAIDSVHEEFCVGLIGEILRSAPAHPHVQMVYRL